MALRRIGQEAFRFSAKAEGPSSLDNLAALIDWSHAGQVLAGLYPSAKGEKAWPPLALFKALLLATGSRSFRRAACRGAFGPGSFRRFCGFAREEETPERTAFVRFRRALAARGLDRSLFEAIARDLEAKGACVRKGTIIDATIIGSASKGDPEAAFSEASHAPARAWLQGPYRGRQR